MKDKQKIMRVSKNTHTKLALLKIKYDMPSVNSVVEMLLSEYERKRNAEQNTE